MTQQVYTFETGAASDRGRVRDINEDNWYADESCGVWLVADGMGGHTNGKLASFKIVESARSVGHAVSAPDLLSRFTDRMFRANDELLAFSASRDNMVLGSTMVSVLIFGSHFACVWAGDSRAYLVRGGDMHQVSRDHTEVQDLLDRGVINAEQANSWPRRNVITRAVGVFSDLELETIHGQVMDGDRFVLCSDGLTGHVNDEEIHEIVARHGSQEACNRLVDLTLERGAKDNVTVVVARCMAAKDIQPYASPMWGSFEGAS
jgi:protein phosphatase